VARAFADLAALSIVQHRASAEAQRLNEQLSSALSSRIVIEQAKGVISERAGTDLAEAFSRLRAYARNGNHRLTDVARAAIDGTLDPLAWTPPSPEQDGDEFPRRGKTARKQNLTLVRLRPPGSGPEPLLLPRRTGPGYLLFRLLPASGDRCIRYRAGRSVVNDDCSKGSRHGPPGSAVSNPRSPNVLAAVSVMSQGPELLYLSCSRLNGFFDSGAS
jgi:hypothetical protein